MFKMNNYNIPTYASLVYDDYLVDIESIAIDKQYNIYKQLFNRALEAYAQEELQMTLSEFKEQYIIINIPVLDFDSVPTSIKIYEKNNLTAGIKTIDLTDYWKDYVYKSGGADNIKMTKDKEGKYEITNIDYVRNEVTLYNRYNDITCKVPLSKINSETEFSYDYLNTNTFLGI